MFLRGVRAGLERGAPMTGPETKASVKVPSIGQNFREQGSLTGSAQSFRGTIRVKYALFTKMFMRNFANAVILVKGLCPETSWSEAHAGGGGVIGKAILWRNLMAI